MSNAADRSSRLDWDVEEEVDIRSVSAIVVLLLAPKTLMVDQSARFSSTRVAEVARRHRVELKRVPTANQSLKDAPELMARNVWGIGGGRWVSMVNSPKLISVSPGTKDEREVAGGRL